MVRARGNTRQYFSSQASSARYAHLQDSTSALSLSNVAAIEVMLNAYDRLWSFLSCAYCSIRVVALI
jgi:hypothetical protein